MKCILLFCCSPPSVWAKVWINLGLWKCKGKSSSKVSVTQRQKRPNGWKNPFFEGSIWKSSIFSFFFWAYLCQLLINKEAENTDVAPGIPVKRQLISVRLVNISCRASKLIEVLQIEPYLAQISIWPVALILSGSCRCVSEGKNSAGMGVRLFKML